MDLDDYSTVLERLNPMFSRSRRRVSEIPFSAAWVKSRLVTHSGPPAVCTNSTSRSDEPIDITCFGDYTDATIQDSGLTSKSHKRHLVRRNPKIPRPCKPCHHIKRNVSPVRDSVYFEHNLSFDSGICADSTIDSEEATPAAWLCKRFGYDFVKAICLDNMPDAALYTFNRPDWFSLVDSFNESVDQLMPSTFFTGEDLAESGIFKDAIQLVLNPRKNLLHFFRNVIDSGLHHKTLGEISKVYRHSIYGRKLLESRSVSRGLEAIPASLKDAVGAHLLYKFGVAPAIQDIVSTLNVHQKVFKRMQYLVKNEGQYVPIRVRRVLPVAFDNSYPSSSGVGVTIRQSAQHTVACIFAQGRVRGGLNAASGFRAYAEYFGLNKVVGTAWELIPFTFVLDWFTNAQERINALTRIHLGEGTFYNLVGLGTSTFDLVEKEVIINPGFDSVYGMSLVAPNSPIAAYKLASSIYNRQPGIPDTSGVVDISTLGSFQGVTSLELLIQKLI